MSDELYDDDQDSEDESQTMRSLRKQLKEQKARAEEAEAAAAEAGEAKRKIVAIEAGLDLNDPKTSYFLNGYKGDWAPDAIRNEAITAGFMAAPPAADQGVPNAEIQSIQRMSNAAVGGSATADAAPSFMEELGQTNSVEEVMRLAEKHGRATSWTSQ